MFLLSPLYYASLLSHLIMCYNSLFNRQTQPFCLIKPLRKSCRIDRRADALLFSMKIKGIS